MSNKQGPTIINFVRTSYDHTMKNLGKPTIADFLPTISHYVWGQDNESSWVLLSQAPKLFSVVPTMEQLRADIPVPWTDSHRTLMVSLQQCRSRSELSRSHNLFSVEPRIVLSLLTSISEYYHRNKVVSHDYANLIPLTS